MHLLITAGGTREYIDPVRFITNASSGRMGYALASAAVKAGHKVTLITTPVDQRPPKGAKIVEVETTAQMFKAVQQQFSRCDCLIMTAAVADYTPVRQTKSKIKKTNKSLNIKLKPTVDILKWAGKNKKTNQIVVGFALEDKAIRMQAEKKLKEKNLDMIIANTPAAIGSDKTSVQIKTTDGKWLRFSAAAKSSIAGRIIKLIEKRKF
ncbi:MAG: phosphopantothenoylcysteine decarboxylase domain-containing protein [Planctomycetota bacterium]|jgi:phosphopantothenoylcysteine decarboxylase/phosphopantothenate--cysteine ligase